MYLMKKQISFCVKKVKSVFNENTDQFCVKKIRSEKYRLVFESFKKKKKKKPNLKMQISLCLEKIIFENTDQFFSFHKRILLAIVDFET